MTATLQRIVSDVKHLSEGEVRELQTLLQTMCVEPERAAAHERVMRKLAAEGAVTLPTRRLDKASPVPITGVPVSELLIEERR